MWQCYCTIKNHTEYTKIISMNIEYIFNILISHHLTVRKYKNRSLWVLPNKMSLYGVRRAVVDYNHKTSIWWLIKSIYLSHKWVEILVKYITHLILFLYRKEIHHYSYQLLKINSSDAPPLSLFIYLIFFRWNQNKWARVKPSLNHFCFELETIFYRLIGKYI